MSFPLLIPSNLNQVRHIGTDISGHLKTGFARGFSRTAALFWIG